MCLVDLRAVEEPFWEHVVGSDVAQAAPRKKSRPSGWSFKARWSEPGVWDSGFPTVQGHRFSLQVGFRARPEATGFAHDGGE